MTKTTATIAAFLIISIPVIAQSNNIQLQFSLTFDDGQGNSSPDTFYAVGSTDILAKVGYDIKDLLAPPSAPGRGVRLYTIDTGAGLIKDFRPYDPNLPNLFFPIQLFAYDTNAPGLTGNCRLDVVNPFVLATIPSDTLVYLRRKSLAGALEKYYDLRDPNNLSIEWAVTNVNNAFATLELVIIDKCLAADLNGSGKIEFKDFANLAMFWLSDVTPLSQDINGDGLTDIDDVKILAEKWLCDCNSS